jgi:hypothetical protein
VLSTPHYPNLEQLAQLISRPLRRIREERQFAIEYFGENDLAAGHHRRRSSRQPPVWRLMPLLTIMFLMSFIDRQNVGFAKLQMVSALGTTEAAYGFTGSLGPA